MPLALAGEIVLLCLDDHTGKCVSPYANYAFNSAVVADLVMLGRVAVEDGHLHVRQSTQTGDPILDEALRTVSGHKRKICEWIGTRIVEHGRDRLIADMVDQKILERVESRKFGLFRYRRYPACSGQVEGEIRERLRAIVLHGATAAGRDVVLLSLLSGGGLLKTFLDREDCRLAADRVASIVSGEPIGAALAQVIRADEDTAAAAVMAAAIT